jgi:hypothetical protein
MVCSLFITPPLDNIPAYRGFTVLSTHPFQGGMVAEGTQSRGPFGDQYGMLIETIASISASAIAIEGRHILCPTSKIIG